MFHRPPTIPSAHIGIGHIAVYTPGYMKESTIAQIETNLYNSKTEKLIWSGVSDTILQKDMEKDAKNLAKVLVKQLKKDGLLPQK
jgi:hypothetical protein